MKTIGMIFLLFLITAQIGLTHTGATCVDTQPFEEYVTAYKHAEMKEAL
jgi:hypothetical protein